jgi:hypothetical protein
LLGDTGLEEGFLVEAGQRALPPGESFGQLCPAIESIRRALMALPLGSVIPDHLQQVQILTGLAYPLG